MEYNLVELVPSEQIGLHSQPGWELSYILEGRGIRTVGDTESPFAEGDMVLVIPEMPHCWRFEESPGHGIGQALRRRMPHPVCCHCGRDLRLRYICQVL